MKKLKIMVLSILLIGGVLTNKAVAQKGTYVNLNLGYNSSLASEMIGTNVTISTDYTGAGNFFSTDSRKAVNGSFGKGMSFGLAFGYMLSDNIGMELGVSKLIGSTYDWTQTETRTFTTGDPESSTSTTKVSSNMFKFNPSIVLSVGKSEGLNAYGKFGVVIGLGSINWEDEGTFSSISSPTSTYFSEFEKGGGIALGLSAAIGANYFFSEKVSLYGELNMINMSYAPTKGSRKKNTRDGVDLLPDATTAYKEYEYVENVSSNTTDILDESQPRQYLKTAYSFSSFGIKIGLRYAF